LACSLVSSGCLGAAKALGASGADMFD
jgi:hypothetical protein